MDPDTANTMGGALRYKDLSVHEVSKCDMMGGLLRQRAEHSLSVIYNKLIAGASFPHCSDASAKRVHVEH